MTLSLYDVSIPVFSRALQNMSAFLEKARTWADETGLEHASASTRQNQQTLGILGKVAARLESEDTWRKGKKETGSTRQTGRVGGLTE